jgi:hypothetical protein
MARYHGVIGFGEPVETDGVWEDVITEKPYSGNVIRNTRRLENGSKVNDDISVGNSISVVSDPYLSGHIFAIRYISWAGALWTVSEVEVQSPRLTLRLGGVYHGPTPPTP